MSIFEGTPHIINRHLFGPQAVDFKQVTGLRLLTERGLTHLNGAALVRELYDHTVERWRAVNGRFPRRASIENWRFTLNPKISEHNASPETQVEKQISFLAEQGRLGKKDEWANQIPVASGLLNGHANKRACIDLAQRMGPRSFDLIELKLQPGSGHALSAAMQLLRYGVLYLFSRRNGRELGYVLGGSGLLGARRMRLIVLAPVDYYKGISPALLQSLRDELNAGLAMECSGEGVADLTTDLDFHQFGEPFQWPSSESELISALLRRHSISQTADYTTQS